MSAASFMVNPLFVADFNRNVSLPPPIIAPLIAPHLKPSVAPMAAASIASLKSPVCIPLTTPAEMPPNAAEEIAKVCAVVAEAANIMLTAGAPTPADTAETVTQTRITPVPIATFFSIVSVETSSTS